MFKNILSNVFLYATKCLSLYHINKTKMDTDKSNSHFNKKILETEEGLANEMASLLPNLSAELQKALPFCDIDVSFNIDKLAKFLNMSLPALKRLLNGTLVEYSAKKMSDVKKIAEILSCDIPNFLDTAKPE